MNRAQKINLVVGCVICPGALYGLVGGWLGWPASHIVFGFSTILCVISTTFGHRLDRRAPKP
jgi:hypothetical protein